jgi:hypothetical protein
MQDPPHPDRGCDKQQACNHEVGDLDPSQVSEAQQAEWVTSGVKPSAGECLDEGNQDEERAGDNAAG